MTLLSETLPAPKSSLPEIVSARSAVALKKPRPPEIISGMLHRGSKLILGGGSKTNKTWAFIDLAISISAGEPWLSHKTSKGSVLYLNMELQDVFFEDRVATVCKAKNLSEIPEDLYLWHLRGHASDYQLMFPLLTERVKSRDFSLIVVDPVYKVLGRADENSATDMTGLLNGLERLAVESGAAIAFAAHFAKGNPAAKESIDRMSGSGALARDPDSILTLTRHEADGAFVLESTLRNFKPMDPFCVRFDYPLFRRAELDPSKLKLPKGGRPAKHSQEILIEVLSKEPVTTGEWQRRCYEDHGVSRGRFYDLKSELWKAGLITANSENKWTKTIEVQEVQ